MFSSKIQLSNRKIDSAKNLDSMKFSRSLEKKISHGSVSNSKMNGRRMSIGSYCSSRSSSSEESPKSQSKPSPQTAISKNLSV